MTDVSFIIRLIIRNNRSFLQNAPVMIQIENIKKSFSSTVALSGISLEIRRQEFFGLLGPNGAGKTTLMHLLVGYLNPDSGKIIIDGDVVTQDNLEIRKKIGFVPQSLAVYDELTAQENLEIFGGLFDTTKPVLINRIRDHLNAVGLYDRRKDKVATYSGGMKRRLNLIASLLHDPVVLLCDEPTVGVDPQSRNAIFDYLALLNREGKTIIYTTHYMEEAERLCTRIGIIDQGKIIAKGSLDELFELFPCEEMIFITKNSLTAEYQSFFEGFGACTQANDRFELKPARGFILSTFFARVEEQGIPYRLIELHRPTLEELFLTLTGRSLRD
jgi:ABC-2 type transport system ATP-binding protein